MEFCSFYAVLSVLYWFLAGVTHGRLLGAHTFWLAMIQVYFWCHQMTDLKNSFPIWTLFVAIHDRHCGCPNPLLIFSLAWTSPCIYIIGFPTEHRESLLPVNRTPSRLAVPSVLSTNVRPVFTKLLDLLINLSSRIGVLTCMICFR